MTEITRAEFDELRQKVEEIHQKVEEIHRMIVNVGGLPNVVMVQPYPGWPWNVTFQKVPHYGAGWKP